ncbi:MAG: hypothetical protein AAFR59_13090, partial [Bacteroidota bacterium]
MRRLLLTTIIFLCGAWGLMAQVNDDFSDGDLTNNPTWTGETSAWQVNAQELQSNGASAQDDIYLVTTNTRVQQTEWRLKMRFSESPSNSNRVRYYLVSDQSDLESALNGYFVEVGENGNDDTYALYRQDGTDTVELIRGPNGQAALGFDVVIRIVRD